MEITLVIKSDDGIVEVSTPRGVYMRDANGKWHQDCVSDKEEHEFDYNIPEQEARQIINDLLGSSLDLSDEAIEYLKDLYQKKRFLT